jgi:hypothetical protein
MQPWPDTTETLRQWIEAIRRDPKLIVNIPLYTSLAAFAITYSGSISQKVNAQVIVITPFAEELEQNIRSLQMALDALGLIYELDKKDRPRLVIEAQPYKRFRQT